jgi:hypothetical protein
VVVAVVELFAGPAVAAVELFEGPAVAGVRVVVEILFSRLTICSRRLSYRLLRVPRVAAVRANVITPNKPTIATAINIGILLDPPIAMSTCCRKTNSRFYAITISLQTTLFLN